MYCDEIGLSSKKLHESITQQDPHAYKTNRHYRRGICHLGLQVIQALKTNIKNALDNNQSLPALIHNIETVSNNFRAHQPEMDALLRHFRYVDKFVNWTIQQELLKVLNQAHRLDKSHRFLLLKKIKIDEKYAIEHNYKLQSYQELNDKQTSRLYLLKDYMNRYRLLHSERKPKGTWLEQMIFSIAAFMSMAFATIIAFATQQSFGNFTTPFFFALVLSYILKDRFKELSRNYIYKKLMRKRCQFNYQIKAPINNKQMALFINGCRYIQYDEISEELKKALYSTRSVNRNRIEDILYYQKKYTLKSSQIAAGYSGINDKIVFNLQKILRNIPKETQTIYALNDKSSHKVKVDKSQLIYIITDKDKKSYQSVKLTDQFDPIS